MVKQNYKWVGMFLGKTQNAWADLLYYTINIIPQIDFYILNNQNQEEKNCEANFQHLPALEKEYIRKNHRFSFKVLKKIIIKNNKWIPSNELTDTLNLFIERGLLKKDRGEYIPLHIVDPLLKYELSQEIRLNNSFPYSFNNFTIKGIPFKGIDYSCLNKDLIKISFKLDKTLEQIVQIQKNEFNKFMNTFYKKPYSAEYRIKNEFRIILKNIKEDIFQAIISPITSKKGHPQSEFSSFLSLIFYGPTKGNKDLINKLDYKSRDILFNYLFEIWDTCPVSYPIITWKKYSPLNGKKISLMYNDFVQDFSKDLSRLFGQID